jgi:hypothetical protein
MGHMLQWYGKGSVLSKSWTPPLSSTPEFFNANLQILAIRIIDNTIFVVGENKLISWHLETGEPVHDEIVAIGASTPHLTLSNDCSQIAFTDGASVSLYDIQAQKILCRCMVDCWVIDLQFSPDSHNLWFLTNHGSSGNTVSLLERGEDGECVNVTTESLSDVWSWADLFSPCYCDVFAP